MDDRRRISCENHHFVPGELVWGKVCRKSWWPGKLYDPLNGPDSTIRGPPAKDEDEEQDHSSFPLLVELFVDNAFAWSDAPHVKPFVSEFGNFASPQQIAERGTGFFDAVTKAVDELKRCLEVEMKCECVREETNGQLHVPLEVGAGVDAPVECTYGLSIVGRMGVSEFLGKYHGAACGASWVNLLEAAVMQSWVAAYSRWVGQCTALPVFHQINGMEDAGDVEMEESTKIGGENGKAKDEEKKEKAVDVDNMEKGKNSTARKSKKKMEEEEINVAVVGGCVNDEEEHGSGRRERKKSKYLSPPYTMMGKNSVLFKYTEDFKTRKLFASGPMVKCSSTKNLFVFDENNIPSMNELLSEFLSVTLDTLYLLNHRYDEIIRGFFDRFRSSVYIQGSNYDDYNSSEALDNSHGGDVKSLSSESENSVSRNVKNFDINISAEINAVGSSSELKPMMPDDYSQVLQPNGCSETKSICSKHGNTQEMKFGDCAAPENCKKRKMDKNSDVGTAILLSFAKDIDLPSNDKLIAEFSKFGVLKESETNILDDSSCARVVFAKCQDAHEALSSSERNQVVLIPGVTSCKLELHHANPSTPPPPPSQNLPKHPLGFVKLSLEKMMTMLNDSPSNKKGMKSEVRAKLVSEMSDLLLKVNDSSSTNTPTVASPPSAFGGVLFTDQSGS